MGSLQSGVFQGEYGQSEYPPFSAKPLDKTRTDHDGLVWVCIQQYKLYDKMNNFIVQIFLSLQAKICIFIYKSFYAFSTFLYYVLIYFDFFRKFI